MQGLLRRLLDLRGRRLTVLVIPQTSRPPWRFDMPLPGLAAGFLVWGAVTIWALAIAGRHTDYWVTKADNRVMSAKMTYLAEEMDRSRDLLELVKSTDKQLRLLLGMPGRAGEPVGDSAVGGPTAGDRMDFRGALADRARGARLPLWRREFSALRETAERRLASFQEISWYIGNQRTLYNATPSIWPTGGQVTSVYGYRLAPVDRRDGELGEYHQGMDIANSPDTLIFATADGTVRHAGWSQGYGRVIVIDHGYGLSTLYAHTSKALVKAGDRVRRGQSIAYMGTTGRSTGAHLHYEVWRQGRPVNPTAYLKAQPGDSALLAGSQVAGKGAGR